MWLIGERPAMKVVFMSGHAEDAIADHGVLDPKFAFLQKPFTPQTLSQKIREALGDWFCGSYLKV